MTSQEESKILSIVEAIEQHLDAPELKSRLNKCSVGTITSWQDENLLDLVHYCILHNNISALLLLLSRGHFKSPYEPATWPYLHLVACMGLRSFISSVIQELKFQNDPVLLDWDIFEKTIRTKIKTFVPSLEDADKKKQHSPIDIAALFGHTGCVVLLLDFWQVQRPSRMNYRRPHNPSTSMYLSLACKVNSPNALRLLLKDHSDKKEALECALRMLAPECVDVVLREGGGSEVKKAFQGMNLFHVLYSYSSCLTLIQYEAMVEITSVLIRHNQNVNALRPSRTFPLHSLLHHNTAGTTLAECSPSLISCLLLLLKAGADPNVDEILIEDKLQDSELNTAFGRGPYSSAINCLLSNLPLLKFNAREDPAVIEPVDNYVCKCIDLLLRHGADLSVASKFSPITHEFISGSGFYYYGTALHLMTTTRPQCPISFKILHLILNYGVDADKRGSWCIPLPGNSCILHYALNILPFSLWSVNLLVPQSQMDKFFTEKDLKIFQYIKKFMSQKSLSLAYAEFKDGLDSLRKLAKESDKLETLESTHLQGSEMFPKIIFEFEEGLKEPWLLQRCCAYTVWRCCRLHMGNVYDLPIPGPLRNVILGFY